MRLAGITAKLASRAWWAHPHVIHCGLDPERYTARARAEGIGDDVRFTGYQPPEQVAEWLRTADVFALPSLTEGLPVVAIEAMASGAPVVATRVGGLSELVEDGGNGYLAPAAAPGALADGIESRLADPELRNPFGRAGRA